MVQRIVDILQALGQLDNTFVFFTSDIVIPLFTGLRTADDFTYVAYRTGEYELYDNAKDPRQLRNRYEAASDSQKARLAAWLEALDGASGESLRQAELNPPKVSGRRGTTWLKGMLKGVRAARRRPRLPGRLR